MLDSSIQEQLRTVFAPLQRGILLSAHPSDHPKGPELAQMLGEVAALSPLIALKEEGEKTPEPTFHILVEGRSSGITFRCVPGGHEFSSFVLALLNAAGLGKLPDEATRKRVAALKGPIELRTYVSLSCTNCPEVVQALNLMAVIHGNLRHTIIDGALAPEEVAALGIQGVPAVFAGDQLLHSGRSDFGELLEKLEERFGTEEAEAGAGSGAGNGAESGEPRRYEVLVLGGGPAGAAAAIYSARKGLKTAVIAQRIGGQVNDTLGITNLISVPKTEGPRLASDLRAHLGDYDIDLFENRRIETVELLPDGAGGLVRAAGGEAFAGDALIVATGAKWRELGVAGEREHIGRGVAFCPHCDGPFFAGKRVAVIGGGNSGVEAAIDLAGICSEVTLLEFTPELRADRVLVENLRRLPNTTILTSARTTEVVGDGKSVRTLRWEDRNTGTVSELPLEGVFVQIGLIPNSGPLTGLVQMTKSGEIQVDAHCRTSVPGVYAAGDVTTVPYKQIVVAMGEGAKAALSAFEDRLRGRA